MDFHSHFVRFKKLVAVTIAVTYLVILAGSIVRATGSGMGCPDWPKCFGMYIPPTDISQLPDNYKEIFKVQGKEIADFNALHTWVEYINRLLGVVMGLLVLFLVIYSFRIYSANKKMLWFSLVIFLATLFQAWLGAKVVSSNLAPVKITLHMVFALIILSALIFQYSSIIDNKQKFSFKIWLPVVLLSSIIIQILLGTQVRQQIDTIASTLEHIERKDWIDELNYIFDIHKTSALLISGMVVFMFVKNFSSAEKNNLLVNMLLILTAAEFFIGMVLNFFGVHAFFQPLHLILSSLMFGVALRIILIYRSSE